METIVLKFGGTSVGSTDRISAVAKLIQQASKEAFPVVVVSAMAGETNRLIELAESFGSEPNKREFDALISTGEKVSASLVAIALNQLGLKAKSLTAAQIGMKTTAQFSKAKILEMDNEIIFKTIADGYIPVVTGFQGITATGDITTMGRGGSDTTAVAIAASIKSKRCDIYTDVDGIYTTDPRIVPDAKKLDAICIEEMLELSGQGAKVIQIRAVEFANKYKVLVRILSSFEPGSGTLILQEENGMEDAVIRGIASQTDQTKFTLHGVVDTPGIASGILSPVSDAGIEVDVIVQNVSVSNKTDFTFTVATTDRSEVETVLKEKMVGISYDELIID